MRNVIFAINMTADGCVDHTKVEGHDEIHEHYARLLRDVDVLVCGPETSPSSCFPKRVVADSFGKAR